MKTKYISILIFLVLIAFQYACEPEFETTDDFAAPSESAVSFTVTPGATDYEVLVENTSSVDGLIKWDFGNGTAASGKSAKTVYQLADTYTIKMTIYTKGGAVTKTAEYVQAKTDYSIFSDPMFINLSGGVDAVNGKTWQLDSTVKGHLGVGPKDGDALTWWSADPLAKDGAIINMYDDEINFNINEFKANYVNHGKSYVKGYVKDAPGFSNPLEFDSDFSVEYTPPTNGKWNVVELDGKKYLQLTASTPLFPCFYVGPKDGLYEIKTLEENLIVLNAIDGVEGNKWNFRLIPKGYVKPKVSFDANIAATANTNEYAVSLSNVVIPAGLAITKVTVNFGDGVMAETTTHTDVLTHTYLRKGKYTVAISVVTSNETINSTLTANIAANHPTYVEYLLNAMVMYNDFGETTNMQVKGQDCGVSVVTNPNKSMWPNRSNNCAMYTKTNQQWANAFMELPSGYRFDLRQQSTFKILVYGKAGQKVLMKLENTDKGGNAWQTGTADFIYTIQKDDTWEIAEYNFNGISAGFDWTGDIFTTNIVTDPNFNHDFYNVVRIMLNPGVGDGTHMFYFDDLAGPHVEGLK